MRKILLLFILGSSFFITNSFAQAGQWTWMNGSNTVGASGVYGTQGTPSAANTPGSMYEMCNWVDQNGNFWLFGGYDYTNVERNDLWEYNPLTFQWTWVKGSGTAGNGAVYGVKGVPSPSNYPGGRSWGAWSFVDNNNNLWMYGGIGPDGAGGYSCQSDLWKYDISTNEWTWMQGPDSGTFAAVFGTKGVENAANSPGARAESNTAWTDKNNNLWLFGGAIYNPVNGGWSLMGYGNDLWKYDMGTNNWVWMKGANTLNAASIYGIKGTAGANNVPSGRGTYTKLTDAAGDLWMFAGYDNNGGNYNDVWKYHIANNEWTWMSGSNGVNGAGTANGKCNAAVNNIPGSRYENRASVVDNCGNLWTMGGGGSVTGAYNDLWKFNPVSLQWTWLSGSYTGNPVPVYGTQGVSSPLNVPDGKMGAGGWMDKSGNFWVFGGMNQIWAQTNDMWRYVPDTSCGACVSVVPPVAAFQASDTAICANDCINFTDHSINTTSWLWTFAGGMPSTSSLQNPQSICYLSSGIYNVTLVASNSGATDSITISNYIHASPAPLAPTIAQSGDTLKCSTDTSYISYQWYYNDTLQAGDTTSIYVAANDGNYDIKITNKYGCSIAAGITVVLNGMMNYGDNSLSVFPNPVSDALTIKGLKFSDGITLQLYNTLGERIIKTEFITNTNEITIDTRSLRGGIYFIHLLSEKGNSWAGRFVKE